MHYLLNSILEVKVSLYSIRNKSDWVIDYSVLSWDCQGEGSYPSKKNQDCGMLYSCGVGLTSWLAEYSDCSYFVFEVLINFLRSCYEAIPAVDCRGGQSSSRKRISNIWILQ